MTQSVYRHTGIREMILRFLSFLFLTPPTLPARLSSLFKRSQLLHFCFYFVIPLVVAGSCFSSLSSRIYTTFPFLLLFGFSFSFCLVISEIRMSGMVPV